MNIQREWAMPNKKTFTIAPIKAFVERAIAGAAVIIDPFANECKYGTVTNDLNPIYDTTCHMDALDFLRLQPPMSADVILYDPPYSLRQVKECYESVGIQMTQEKAQASWRARHLDEIARILKIGGKCLCFGWNSNGVGMKRGFEMVDVLIVPHGGSKNDTICTLERKERDQQKIAMEG